MVVVVVIVGVVVGKVPRGSSRIYVFWFISHPPLLSTIYCRRHHHLHHAGCTGQLFLSSQTKRCIIYRRGPQSDDHISQVMMLSASDVEEEEEGGHCPLTVDIKLVSSPENKNGERGVPAGPLRAGLHRARLGRGGSSSILATGGFAGLVRVLDLQSVFKGRRGMEEEEEEEEEDEVEEEEVIEVEEEEQEEEEEDDRMDSQPVVQGDVVCL